MKWYHRGHFEPLPWQFLLNPHGTPQEFPLETGFVYRVKGILGPESRLRIADENGYARLSISSESHPARFNAPFTMEKDAGSFVLVQYLGTIHEFDFYIDGIDTKEFV